MGPDAGAPPTEAAYYISVTQDMLTNLELLLQRLQELEGQRQEELRAALEKKMDRALYERLPRLMQQLWHEICRAFTSAGSLHGVDCMAPGGVWDQLAHQCAQLSFFRSIHEYVAAVRSGRAPTSASNTVTSHRCIERLLKERENIWASVDGKITSEWLRGFVKHLLLATAFHEKGEDARLDQLEKSVALGKEALQEPNTQGRQQHSGGVGAPTLRGESDGDVFEEGQIRQEYVRFFREACMGVADDLLSLARQKALSQSPSPAKHHAQAEKNTIEGEEGMGGGGDLESNGDAGISALSDLIAGDDRWVFFRVRPDDHPTLTVDEVACQVRAFYGIYNAAKSPMAAVLAEEYGDDYAELFDVLEYRYCIPKTSDASLKPGVVLDVSEDPPDGQSVHVDAEPTVEARVESDTHAGGCWVM